MSSIKISSIVAWLAKHRGAACPAVDALDHPAIRAMEPRLLADLPLTPDWPHARARSVVSPRS